MNFSEALRLIKAGQRVTRLNWNGPGQFVFLVPGSTFKVNRPPLDGMYPRGTSVDYLPHIDIKTKQGPIVPWLASQTDLLADDWQEVKALGFE
jgi:hypothetical protein